MNLLHKETNYLYNNIISDETRNCITEFITLEVEVKEDYSTCELWKMDQKIGGIGGYAMNPNPVINPFPSGIKRSLYRPLQYARSVMDYCDISMHARYIISNCGLHLEAVCKLILKENKTFGKIRYNNITLGKSVHLMTKLDIINKNIIEALFQFVKLYNLSKHEVNQDISKERFFNAMDAITAYFSVRFISQYLLKIINFQDSDSYFEIIPK